jgi:MFS transporter, putative metabolite:H+ symporter
MDASAPRTAELAPTEGAAFAAPSRRYLGLLLALLMSATVFEGYDITIFHLCTPDIAKSFHLGDPAIGVVATIVRIGGMLSFFVVTLADQLGRKPVVSVTILFYALFTLFTAISSGVITFTTFQGASQIFLAAEFALAITMISEEFPDRMRGRAISVMHMVAFIGVSAAGLLYGYMAESRWGWRGMYLLGIAPLLLVAFLRRWLRETGRFEALRVAHEVAGRKMTGAWQTIRNSISPFRSQYYRTRLILIAALWNCIGLVGGPTITFFSLYAKRDHHWTSRGIGAAIVLAYLMGTIGTLLSGYLMDKVGRRITAMAFYLTSAAAMYLLFQTGSDHAMLLAEIVTMFAYQASRTATSAFSSELFPTEIRCTGYSLTVQVLGQVGWALSPVVVGLLSGPMGGLGNAAALFSSGPVLGAILILAWAPETRGRTLEELSPSRLDLEPPSE